MIERKVTAMHKYEEFLEKVKSDNSDKFTEISDIISRYDTLKKTNKDLVNDSHKLQEELDKLTEDATQYEKEKTNEILRMNNSIAEYQKGLEKAEDEKNRKQRTIEEGIKNSRIQSKQLSQLIMAVNNLYWRCRNQSKTIGLKYEGEGSEWEPYKDTKETIKKAKGQLEVVGQFIHHGTIILDEAQKPHKGHDVRADTKKNVTLTKTTHH